MAQITTTYLKDLFEDSSLSQKQIITQVKNDFPGATTKAVHKVFIKAGFTWKNRPRGDRFTFNVVDDQQQAAQQSTDGNSPITNSY